MANNIDLINEIKISEIFDDAQYIVPIYQRNYAWNNREIEQLIDDINDAIKNENKDAENDKNYFLGTLIVDNKENNLYEVIDGQQRLTTLYLLKKFLERDNKDLFDSNADKLLFEAREKYKRTLQNIYYLENEQNTNNYYAQELKEGYDCIKNYFNEKKSIDENSFKDKLKKVSLVRVQVPKNIDLNHYFEIMNTRGEQLEPHEILKAKILGKFETSEDKKVAADIWEKCSDMNNYIQKKFEYEWNEFQPTSFDELKEILVTQKNSNKTADKDEEEKAEAEDNNIKKFINDISNKKENEILKIIDSLEFSLAEINEVIESPNLVNMDKEKIMSKLHLKKDSPLKDVICFMERYVNKISQEEKNKLWNFIDSYEFSLTEINENIEPANLENIYKNILLSKIHLKMNSSLEDVIKFSNKLPKYPQDDKHKNEEENNDKETRFKSIISFPNFLLQVNAILNCNLEAEEQEGFLDDKNFLKIMEINYKDQTKAKTFVYSLLKYRFLFDKYVLKRDFGKNRDEGEWSLKKIKKYNNSKFNYVNTFRVNENSEDDNEPETKQNTQLKLLQASLRITYTSPKTMKWIAKLLKKADENPTYQELIAELENYCRKAVSTIFDENSKFKNLKYGELDRIVFSYLDYILYRDGHEFLDEYIRNGWKCVYRNSIEHFSPQTGGDFSDNPEILDCFGNLALITVSGNSKFSNMRPEQKILEKGGIINQSLKLSIMAKHLQNVDKNAFREHLQKYNWDKNDIEQYINMPDNKTWNETVIKYHQKDMIEILKNDIEKLKKDIKES